MRDETRYSASRLRLLAKVAFVVGLVMGLLLFFLGLYNAADYKNSYSDFFRSISYSEALGATYFLGTIISSVAIIFGGYVSYIIFDAFATAIENIDKTQICKSIDRLSYTMLLTQGDIKDEKILNELRGFISKEQGDETEETNDTAEIKE